MSDIRKAVAYARYSSDNQRAESIDAQLYDIREWASANGYQIIKEYIDEAISGTSDEREQFLQMIVDARDNNFETVLVHKTDRFARNKYDAAIYKKILQDNDVSIVYVTQPMLSGDTPESFLMETIFEGFDQYYSLNLSREVMKGMGENARNCKHNGGLPPLGFDVDKDTRTYIINEREAKAVQIIYKMYDMGYSYDKILKTINSEGYKTKTGGTFGKNSISDILRNEKYTGVYIFNRTLRKVSGKRNHRKSKPDDQVIRVPGGMPRIIDQALWDRVQKRIEGRSRNMGERSRNHATKEYLLSGKIFCGKCGFAMIGKSGTNAKKIRYDYYLCNKRDRKHECEAKMVRKDLVDRQVLEQLKCEFFDPKKFPSLAKEICRDMQEHGNESEKEIIYLTAEMGKIKVKINNMIDQIEDGAGSAILTKRLEQRESELTVIENRIRDLERQRKASVLTEGMILEYLTAQYKGLKADDTVTAKRLINQFIHKVIVHENDIEIIFTISLLTGGGGGACHIVRKQPILPARAYTKPFSFTLLKS